MPRVMVITDQAERDNAAVLLDEQVHSVHLSTDHSAMQFIERLGWAITDAEDAEHVDASRRPLRRTAPRGVGRRVDAALLISQSRGRRR